MRPSVSPISQLHVNRDKVRSPTSTTLLPQSDYDLHVTAVIVEMSKSHAMINSDRSYLFPCIVIVAIVTNTKQKA